MLTYRVWFWVFWMGVLGVCWAVFSQFFSVWLGLILLFLASLPFAVGAYFIQLNFYVKARHKVKNENAIALTFDDGPWEGYTEQVLDLLKKYDQKATFFLIGKHAKRHPEIIKRMYNEGHSIGGHSMTHTFWFDLKSPSHMRADILEAQETISQITQIKTHLFRPPYGVTNPIMVKALKGLDLQVVGWSLRSYDTSISSAERLLQRLQKVKPGDIILLHEKGPFTLEVLESFMIWYAEKGLRSVGLDGEGFK